MSTSNEHYSEAWCTNLLLDQQTVNERMGKLLRTLKDTSIKEEEHTEEWYKELLRDGQAVNEKMTKLLRDQQRTIDGLHRKFASEGQEQPSTTGKYHNEHLLGPNSTAITWTGSIEDLVPISVGGKEYKALIMTDKLIQSFNDLFETDKAIVMMKPEVYTERDYQDYLKKLPATGSNPGVSFPLDDDIPQAEFSDKELAKMFSDSEDRQTALEYLLEWDNLTFRQATEYVKGFMRKAFKKNKIDRQEDLKEQIFHILLTRTETLKGRIDDGNPWYRKIEATVPEYGSDSDSETFGRLT
ncbi:hypothetical protein VTL71DRAFT_6171 [Oculimacula yallundae]|uniref:Uncharacterized protein n=1 Tax=Oculimacula yallundae TaxID=86028 RepID=A0ABR4BZK9_9HELO